MAAFLDCVVGRSVILRDARPLKVGTIVSRREPTLDSGGVVEVSWKDGESNWLDPGHLRFSAYDR